MLAERPILVDCFYQRILHTFKASLWAKCKSNLRGEIPLSHFSSYFEKPYSCYNNVKAEKKFRKDYIQFPLLSVFISKVCDTPWGRQIDSWLAQVRRVPDRIDGPTLQSLDSFAVTVWRQQQSRESESNTVLNDIHSHKRFSREIIRLLPRSLRPSDPS